jgi:hypothetical protein
MAIDGPTPGMDHVQPQDGGELIQDIRLLDDEISGIKDLLLKNGINM